MSILKCSGFSDEDALKLIDEKWCDKLEKYMNKHKTVFADVINNTVYAKFDEFELLPGHRALLLNLPSKIAAIDSKKKEQTKKNSVTETVYFNEHGFEETGELIDDDSNVDDNSDVYNLTHTLIEKVKNYWTKQKIGCDEITSELILDLKAVNGCHRCLFQCPYCSKKIPCTFKKYWEVGNLQSHLKLHVAEANLNDTSNNNLLLQTPNKNLNKTQHSGDVSQLTNQQNSNVNEALNELNQ